MMLVKNSRGLWKENVVKVAFRELNSNVVIKRTFLNRHLHI